MADKVKWLTYEFSVHGIGATWSKVAGIYIFTGVNAQNQWVALYIGQASSFAERLPNHDRWSEAHKLGATHVHARVESLQANRDKIEKELIQAFQPRLNTQLK